MSAETLNTTRFAYALKTIYSDRKVLSSVVQNNPAFAMVRKSQDFYGDNHAFSVIYSPATRAFTFSTAQGNTLAVKGKKFILTRAHDYSLGLIDTETIEASKKNAGAMIQAMKTQGNGCLQAIKNAAGFFMYGNGSGLLGTVANSSYATTDMTLNESGAVKRFHVGQTLVAAANEASALRTGTLVVDAINRDTGVITMTGNMSAGISAIAQNDAIFTQGDYVSASDRNLLVGYGGWIPKTAPSSGESFFSVDRSDDVVGLAGSRYTDTTDPGLTTEEVIIFLASKVGDNGGNADTAFMGTMRFKDFVISLGNKVRFIKETVNIKVGGKVVAQVGFDGIEVHCGGSVVKVFPDRNCPETEIHVQQLDTWEFKSMGQFPRWLETNMTKDSADAKEMRLGGWGNLKCECPAWNARYDFSA